MEREAVLIVFLNVYFLCFLVGLFVCLFVAVVVVWPRPWYMEVPGPKMESEPELQPMLQL